MPDLHKADHKRAALQNQQLAGHPGTCKAIPETLYLEALNSTLNPQPYTCEDPLNPESETAWRLAGNDVIGHGDNDRG